MDQIMLKQYNTVDASRPPIKAGNGLIISCQSPSNKLLHKGQVGVNVMRLSHSISISFLYIVVMQMSSRLPADFSQEEEQIKKTLREIPMGELLLYAPKPTQSSRKLSQIQKKKHAASSRDEERAMKGDSREIKILRAPLRVKQKPIFTSSRPKAIDPRFEEYAGSLNPDLAAKSFSFIPKMQQIQSSSLKNRLKNPKLPESEKAILTKHYSALRDSVAKNKTREVERQAKSGSNAGSGFYLKRKDLKEQIESKKLESLGPKDQRRRIREKEKKIQKKQMVDRKRGLK